MNQECLRYDQSGIQVRQLKCTDRFELKESDKVEVRYLGIDPNEALSRSLRDTLYGYTVLIDNEPQISFGINAYTLFSNEAVIWMLSSERITDISRRFVRHSREYVDEFLTHYKTLFNYVHEGNKSSVNWLKYLGAKMENPKPYGKFNQPFMRFTFERTDIR